MGVCGLIGAAAFGTEVSLDMNSILVSEEPPGRPVPILMYHVIGKPPANAPYPGLLGALSELPGKATMSQRWTLPRIRIANTTTVSELAAELGG